MKILHIHFGTDGGAERFFVNLVGALDRRGVEQQVMIRPDRGWRADVPANVVVHEGNFRRVSLSRFVLGWRLNRLVDRFAPDVVMSWQLRASRAMPTRHGPRRIARLGDYPEHLGYYRNVETLVAITPDIADRCRALGWTGGLEVIPNFTNARAGTPVARRDLATPEDAFVVCAFGRFVPRKGFDVLLRAVARLPNSHLWLLGDGPSKEALVALAAELGIADRVHMPGWRSDAYAYLAAADAFTITSRHEPLGNVCFEGWGVGVPTVAAKSEGPSWAMRDGVDALLVERDDPEALATALAQLRDQPALRARLVAGGREALATRFSEDAVVASYLRLFETGSSAP